MERKLSFDIEKFIDVSFEKSTKEMSYGSGMFQQSTKIVKIKLKIPLNHSNIQIIQQIIYRMRHFLHSKDTFQNV